MRRRAIPPLCGGAVQALPNFQTTLRYHPHPASRPMTFGHFTSWHADDRGYYIGAWVQCLVVVTFSGHWLRIRLFPLFKHSTPVLIFGGNMFLTLE